MLYSIYSVALVQNRYSLHKIPLLLGIMVYDYILI